MNKRTAGNVMSREKKVFEQNVAKLRKLNQSKQQRVPIKRAASEDEDGDPLLERTVTPELLIEMPKDQPKSKYIKRADDEDVLTLLKQILDKQSHLEARMRNLETTLDELVTSSKQNKRTKAAEMARDKVMRECKVLTEKVHKSICRLTGEEDVDPILEIDIPSILPITSFEEAKDVDEKLRDQEFHNAMRQYLVRLKCSDIDFESIIRKLYSDEFLWHMNWEGIKGKHSLMQFSLAAELLSECSDFIDRSAFESAMRKCISKSHNRTSQKRYLDRQNLEKSKLQ